MYSPGPLGAVVRGATPTPGSKVNEAAAGADGPLGQDPAGRARLRAVINRVSLTPAAVFQLPMKGRS